MLSLDSIMSFIKRPQRFHRFKHLCRYLIMRQFEPSGRYMRINVKGLKLAVKRNSGMRYPSIVWINGYYEKDSSSYIEKILKPKDIVIDVGANAGYFTLLMAKLVGPEGKVYSFEADREMYNLLVYNIKQNGFDNIEARNFAASNKNGFIDFYINRVGGYSSLFNREFTREKVVVPTMTIDSLHLSNVRFVKMDVECAEFVVLEGMRETLAKNKEMELLLEYAPIECGVNITQYIHFFHEHELFFIDENNILVKGL